MDVEFTVEAGRPDTITYDKLKIMDDMGVTRISVNPQSLNDKTIALIGRGHTAADFYAAYDMARKFSFDVNCDLIAGLPGEEAEDFARTADGIFALRPENVTVHTLALKKVRDLNSPGTTTALPTWAQWWTTPARLPAETAICLTICTARSI